MAQHIKILPESLTNKIAAGEVVERPASVIKELIENALDAGATDISVDVTAGGRRRIRVIDNGHGMSREDALLSLERHATSKIKVDTDLDKIVTLGFRGEAIPSIASVSRLTLASRELGLHEGTEIVVEGGRVCDVKVCGMATGSVITVDQLFFNIPARLKFMKSAETEIGHVGDVVARLAVSRPDVAFRLTSDEKELLQLQRSDVKRRLSQIVGKESSRHLYPVDAKNEYMSITGFISSPALVRSGTQGIYTYINGRFIRDKVVQHAIMQAYRGVIDKGRYPVVALFIEISPSDVDVNVHPTKHEVRFIRQSVVHDAIKKAVEDVLSSSPWLLGLESHISKPSFLAESTGQAYRERIAAAAQASLVIPPKSKAAEYNSIKEIDSNAPFLATPTVSAKSESSISEATTQFNEEQDQRLKTTGYFSSLNIIGQYHSEYIICQSDSEMVIIDQHAASERVAYQLLKRQYQSGGIESQRLLFTENVELSFVEFATADRFSNNLAEIGFELEPFGGRTMIILAAPRIAARKTPIILLREILNDLEQFGSTAAFSEILDNILARIACHSVVRGVHLLENRQIKELLQQMDQTDFAASCPHGRPVSHVLTLSEIQKIFKRT